MGEKQQKDGGLRQELISRLIEILPTRRRIDWSRTLAARWCTDKFGGGFEEVDSLPSLSLDDLLEVDRQKHELVMNTRQFCAGLPANNALLWGARGTGKSSLIHAILNQFADDGLRIAQVEKEALADIANIAGRLDDTRYRFLLVCDDLSFDEDDDGYKKLKSALEGSVFTSANNVLIYATSNRRHLITEFMHDNLDSTQSRGELHASEAIEEKISLSDRFGLWLSFRQFKQDEYLRVAEFWFKKIASEHNMKVNWTQHQRQESLTWALNRGVRSGRTAHHFANYSIGRMLLEQSNAT